MRADEIRGRNTFKIAKHLGVGRFEEAIGSDTVTESVYSNSTRALGSCQDRRREILDWPPSKRP